MKLVGQHRIVAHSLMDLRDQLDALPDSVLSNAQVNTAEVMQVEERTLHEDYFVNYSTLILEVEWAVEPD